MVPGEGIELPTNGLQDRWSTAEPANAKNPAKPAPAAVSLPARAWRAGKPAGGGDREAPAVARRSCDVPVERPTLGELFF